MRMLRLALLIVVGATGLAACHSGVTTTAASSQPGSSSQASTVGAVTPIGATTSPASTATSSAGGSAAPSPCTGAGLAVTVGTWNGAGGHGSLPLVFRNMSGAACTLTGYPGVAALAANGRQAVQATRTLRGYSGGLPNGTTDMPMLTLQPRDMARAVLEWLESPPPGVTCLTYPAILVTPPNTTRSTRLPASHLSVCRNFQVHPVQPAGG